LKFDRSAENLRFESDITDMATRRSFIAPDTNPLFEVEVWTTDPLEKFIAIPSSSQGKRRDRSNSPSKGEKEKETKPQSTTIKEFCAIMPDTSTGSHSKGPFLVREHVSHEHAKDGEVWKGFHVMYRRKYKPTKFKYCYFIDASEIDKSSVWCVAQEYVLLHASLLNNEEAIEIRRQKEIRRKKLQAKKEKREKKEAKEKEKAEKEARKREGKK